MEHFRVGGVRFVLRYADNITGSDLPHGLHKKLCAERFEPVKELPGRFKLADLRFARSDHVPASIAAAMYCTETPVVLSPLSTAH